MARDRLKDIFDNGPFYIGGCSELGYKTFDIKQYGYILHNRNICYFQYILVFL